MTQRSDFKSLGRQQFRKYFQPSRVLIGLFPAPTPSGVNPITLCFSMYCSYKPPMMALAVQVRSATYQLVDKAEEFVLAVPGPTLLYETMTSSLLNGDKVKQLALRLCPSKTVSVPGLADAIANVELVKHAQVVTGDHKLVVGRVVDFRVNERRGELPLLSVGPDLRGYTLLLKKGVHRLAIAAVD